MVLRDIFDTSGLMSCACRAANYLLIHKGFVVFYKCNIIYRARSQSAGRHAACPTRWVAWGARARKFGPNLAERPS